MKYRFTENEEKKISKKNAQVSVVTLNRKKRPKHWIILTYFRRTKRKFAVQIRVYL